MLIEVTLEDAFEDQEHWAIRATALLWKMSRDAPQHRVPSCMLCLLKRQARPVLGPPESKNDGSMTCGTETASAMHAEVQHVAATRMQ